MNHDSLNLTVNGKQYQVDGNPSVSEFLATTGFKPTQVVVEHNGRVLERHNLGEIMLHDGDRLEIIVPVAGG